MSLAPPQDDMSSSSSFPSDPPSPPSPSASFVTRPLNVARASIRGQTPPFPSSPTSWSHPAEEPPPGVTYAEFIRTWTDAHVARWLADIKCSNYVSMFKENDIRGDILLELDQQTLREMGISSIGDRLRICNGVKALRQRTATATAATTTRSPTPEPRRGADSRSRQNSGSPARGGGGKQASRPAPLLLDNDERNPPSTSPATERRPPGPRSPSPLTVTRHPPPRSSSTHVGAMPLGVPGANQTHRKVQSQAVNNNNNSSFFPDSPPTGPPPAPPSKNLRGATSMNNMAPNLLSPINESFNNRGPPPQYGAATGAGGTWQQQQQQQYSTMSPNPGYSASPSLVDLKRKHVKFIVAPEPYSFTSQTFTIDVGNCASGYEVLDKALKKVGRSRSGDSAQDDFPNATFTEEGGLVIDGWGAYLPDSTSEGERDPMSDVEIMSLCAAPPGHPTREKGLMLRRSFNLHPQSQLSTSPVGSSSLTRSQTRRASAISILSGLGVRDPELALASPSPIPTPPSSGHGESRIGGKLRNFLGQRPPSELITDHLQDYFPGAQKKILDKTRNSRQSLMAKKRSTMMSFMSADGGAGMGTWAGGDVPAGMLAPPVPLPLNLGAGTSGGNKRKSVMVGAAGGPGAAGITSSGNKRKTVMLSAPPPLPPAEEDEEEDQDAYGGVDASAPSDGLGRKTSLRSKRATRLNAVTEEVSLDEITAEVEHKRRSQQQQPQQEESSTLESDGWTRVDEDGETDGETDEGTLVNTEEGDDEGGDKEGKVDDEDEEEEAAFKWIKGALIGAGSFGKVYLGMDAESGFLMAVKQVELPDEEGPNLEQKRTMLTALEREIDLLRDLQHENIVQYYYSSMDDDYLNIFLEYVPGGSVTALLQNYGAFEEPLVKNFVRQILEGLNYLHEQGIIHRDIKGGNILVDNKGSIKITDFGVSKKVETATLQPGTKNKGGKNRASLQGSVFWMAPEVVKQTVYTKKADIWSVGCLIVEMLTGDHPWGKLSQFQALFKIGSGTAKPNIPSDISNEAQDFLDKTFELDYTVRPSATELLAHSWLAKKPLPFFRKPGMVREVSEPI
ncbi:STE/STE11 protein kinase [Flagelloscypha sp. PMI_526]|nr:STE/STE11 protein kinase [Flagelloscypha sp. PMI_526]